MHPNLQAWLDGPGEEPIWEAFDDRTFDRGFEYADRGLVASLHITARGVRGSVLGSGGKRYQVQVTIPSPEEGTAITSLCSCPVGMNCKHGVAVLLEVLAEQDPVYPEPPPGNQGLTASGQTDLPVQFWLERVGREVTESSSNQQLVYVIHCPGRGRMEVEAWKGRVRKDGQYGRLELYTSDGRSGARFLTGADRRALPLMRMTTPAEKQVYLPAVLRELAETGRAHLETTAGPVLKPGAALEGNLAWVSRTSGEQVPAVGVETPDDVIAIGCDPLWYVEPHTGRTGPLTVDLPDPRARELLDAPPVKPAMAAQTASRLAEVAPSLPRPVGLEQRRIEGESPVPVLSLESVSPAEIGEPGGGEPLSLGRVRFDYAGVPVSALADESETHQVRDGIAYAIRRDLAQERAALAVLEEQGVARFKTGGELVVLPGEGRDWPGFLYWVVPDLQAAGWRVEQAPDFPFRMVAAEDWYADLEAEGEDWFGLELGVDVEGERYPLGPMLVELIREAPELVGEVQHEAVDPEAKLLLHLGDGRMLPVPVQRVAPFLRTLVELHDQAAPAGAERLRLPLARAGVLADLEGEEAPLRWEGETGLRELAGRLTRLERTEAVAEPEGLQATLRDYQRAGVGWLQALASQGLGGVLADDMGLGKTIQVLAHLLHEKAAGRTTGPSLVVAPRSLLFNWEQEAARFAPELNVLRFHGSGRHQELASLPEQDLVLSTYSTVTRDVEVLAQQPFHLAVLDEAQAVKNDRSRSAQAVRQLQAHQRLALTGTPLENHLGEFWSLFDFLMPGLLGDRDTFNRLFRRPIERAGDSGRQAALQQRIRPFLLRRTKEAIAPELPACTEVRYHAELTGAQRDLYETVRVAMHERVQQEVARRGLARSQLVVLDALLKLRQVCCDPRLLKMESARSVQQSAKLAQLKELLAELHAEGRRILLFSQFTGMLDLIEAELPALGIDYVKLTGRTRKREERVARFQAGEVPLFLISLKAGGTGLNLTAADAVIHYDPWWNPAVMQQATDRAHRIGQDKPVFVYHLLTRDTVEERITDLQARKAELGAWLLGGEGGSAPSLAMEDVEALFQPLE